MLAIIGMAFPWLEKDIVHEVGRDVSWLGAVAISVLEHQMVCTTNRHQSCPDATQEHVVLPRATVHLQYLAGRGGSWERNGVRYWGQAVTEPLASHVPVHRKRGPYQSLRRVEKLQGCLNHQR